MGCMSVYWKCDESGITKPGVDNLASRDQSGALDRGELWDKIMNRVRLRSRLMNRVKLRDPSQRSGCCAMTVNETKTSTF